MISIEKRKQNWVDFYDLNSDVNRMLLVECPWLTAEKPMLWWEKADDRVNWAYENYERQMENTAWLHDSKVPFMSMITGTEIFAEAFGCGVHKPLNNNPCAMPLVFSTDDLYKVKVPKVCDTKLSILFDMADKLKKRAGKDALLSLPDVQTPMDIAALIWEKSDFFPALYEEPEAVKELTFKIKEFMFEFFDQWFLRYGKEFSAHFPDYYMPYGITMSEDEIGCVNSGMYKEFFEKELHEFSERYGQIGIHCCADAAHQWENLKNVPNLKLINIGKDEQQVYDSAKLFENVCAQFPLTQGIDIPRLEKNSKIHYVRQITVQTRQEAIDAVSMFQSQDI